MKNLLQNSLTLIFLFNINTLIAQVAPDIEWQKCLGGSGNEAAFSTQQTTDGGFIIAGYSDLNNGDVTGNHGSDDYWIVKLNGDGTLIWEKSFGGNSIDEANAVEQTTDGGYIIAGFSYSANGNVTGNHGADDYWVVKLDSAGNLLWQKSLGGTGDDGANSIQQTSDGGYVVAGWSSSTNGDVTGNHGLWDYWLVKLDASGNLMWQHSFGGSQNDVAYQVQQTEDGKYIIAGYSESNDGDVGGNHGARDYWIVKTDAGGNLLWQTFMGGTGYDEAHAVQPTSDGGFIVGGFAGSSDGDVIGNHGIYDYWVVKLDSGGTTVWKKCFGGALIDQPFSIQQTTEGGFIVVGQSNSHDGDVSGNHGGYDFWMAKLDKTGNLEWQKSLGGTVDEYGPYRVDQTVDGGYIIGGASLSNDNDVSGNHGGSFYGDFWIVKLEGSVATGITMQSYNALSVFPNPAQNQIDISLKDGLDNLITSANTFTVRVYDVQGRMINLPASDLLYQATSIHLNTGNLPDGFYTLQLISNKTGEIEITKFVEQH